MYRLLIIHNGVVSVAKESVVLKAERGLMLFVERKAFQVSAGGKIDVQLDDLQLVWDRSDFPDVWEKLDWLVIMGIGEHIACKIISAECKRLKVSEGGLFKDVLSIVLDLENAFFNTCSSLGGVTIDNSFIGIGYINHVINAVVKKSDTKRKYTIWECPFYRVDNGNNPTVDGPVGLRISNVNCDLNKIQEFLTSR